MSTVKPPLMETSSRWTSPHLCGHSIESKVLDTYQHYIFSLTFHNRTPLLCFKLPRHSSCRTRQSQASCRFDLHETIRVVDLS